MQDTDLYRQILGLVEPWSVTSVRLDAAAQEIVVRVEHPPRTQFPCPKCGTQLACRDHERERRWRHLDSCQFKTILVGRVPRIECPEHGVQAVEVPWAQKSSRFTILFERFAIDVLLATQTVQGAISLLRIGWGQAWRILERAVARGQLRKREQPCPYLGSDEKSFAKGQSYVTLLYDLNRSTVEALADGNDAASAEACFAVLSADQRQAVKAIAMDMSAAFVKATRETFPLADTKIVHDRFHVMQLASKAVDAVRRQEHRRLKREGDDSLKGTKYVWLRSQERLSADQQEVLESRFAAGLETARAWGYKELLRELWDQPDEAGARRWFTSWYRRVARTKLTPLKRVAKTIKERLDHVVSFCTHRITNAVAEGINSKIQSIKRRVCGFRNRENYKTAIHFYCGGLDLHPR